MPKRRLCFVSVIILICFLFVVGDINAQAPTPYPVAKDQSAIQSIYNSQTDQFFSVWGDCRDVPPGGVYCCGYCYGDSSDIFGQIVNAGNGSCFGGNIHIAGGTIGHTLPAVSYNPGDNEYLVVWQGFKEDYVAQPNSYGIWQEKGYDIYGQRISGLNGAKIGGFIKIAPNPVFLKSPCFGHANNPAQECDDNQWHPRIAYSTTSRRYLVTWHDGRTRAQQYDLFKMDSTDQTTFKDIYGQIVNADGTLSGDNFPVAIDPANTNKVYHGNAKRIQQYSEIAYDSDNNRFLVVWEDDRDSSGNPHPAGQRYDCLNLNIYGGFFDTNGQPVVKYDVQNRPINFRISGLTDAERYPKIAYNPVSHEFLVVWQSAARPSTADCASGTYANLGYIKVYGQRISSTGDLIGNPYVIDDRADVHDQYMHDYLPPWAGVTVNSLNGKFLVAWEREGSGTKGRWIEPDGTMGQTFDIISGIDENRVFIRNKPSAGDLYITGFYRPYPYPNNFPVFTYKTSPMQYFTNCPASGDPPLTITPTTTNCPNGDIGNLDCDVGGRIDNTDKEILLNSWSPSGPVPTPVLRQHSADLSGDNFVSEADLTILLDNWRP